MENMMCSSKTRPQLSFKNVILAFAVLAAGLNSSLRAQDAVAAKVDEYVKKEMQRQHIPGLSLAVVKDGQIILAKGYGLANVEHQVPVKPETIFPIRLNGQAVHGHGRDDARRSKQT
jgi:CubicO group peptidase (beta-lactamase class C family)